MARDVNDALSGGPYSLYFYILFQNRSFFKESYGLGFQRLVQFILNCTPEIFGTFEI